MSNSEEKDERPVAGQNAPEEYGEETEAGTRTTVKVPRSPTTSGETGEKGKETRERLRTFLTVVALVVSGLSLHVSFGSRDASQQSANAAKRTAGAAEDSAAAARWSADIAQQSLNLSIRPGVKMTVSPTFEVAAGETAIVNFTIHNFGPGTAKNLGIAGKLISCPSRSDPSSCRNPCPTKPEFFSDPPLDLEIGEKKEMARRMTPPDTQAHGILSGDLVPLFCGVVTYGDVLGRSGDLPFCYIHRKGTGRWEHCLTRDGMRAKIN